MMNTAAAQDVNDFWQTNTSALARFKPHLHQQVVHHAAKPVGELVATPAGVPTLKYMSAEHQDILAYNPTDPWQDAAEHLATVAADARGLVAFIGMGLGYGPLLVFRERPSVPKIVIVEPSLDHFCTALHAVDLTPLIAADRVFFFLGDSDLAEFRHLIARLAAIEDTSILRHVPSFRFDPRLYHDTDNKIFMVINHLNSHGGTTVKCGEKFFRNRLSNLTMLRHSYNVEGLKDCFRDKPAILVAAGPSLNRSLPFLKKAAGKCVIIAADSALAPLLKAGVTPDFVTSIDYQDVNFEKLIPFLGQQWPFSLVAMIKCTPFVPKCFPARRLFFAFPEDRPHDWLVEALGVQEYVPEASSVVHLSLGLALLAGADPIIFLGQDLAFTDQILDHASGTIFTGADMPADSNMLFVEGLDGGKVPTSRNHMVSKKLFEDIIAANPRTYLNASAAGARIEGAERVEMPAVLESYLQADFSVPAQLEEKLGAAARFDAGKLLEVCQRILAEVKKTSVRLKKARELGRHGCQQLAALRKKRYPADSLGDLPGPLVNHLVKFDKENKGLDALEGLWTHLLEITFQALSNNDQQRDRNETAREQEGYLGWVLAEIKRINEVNRMRLDALGVYRKELDGLVGYLQKEERLEKAVAAERGDADANRLLLSRLYCDAGNVLLAGQLLDGLNGHASDDLEANLLRGEICCGLLDMERADEFFVRALAVNPALASKIASIRRKYAEVWLAVIEENGEKYPHLLAGWIKRVASFLDDDAALVSLIDRFWRMQQDMIGLLIEEQSLELAERKLVPWLEFADLLPAVYYLRARCAAQKEDQIAAIQDLQKALILNPDEPHWRAFLARNLLEAGRFDEGLAALQQAVKIDPQTAVLWEELGDTLMDAGDFRGAAQAFEQCFVALPDHVEPLRKIGDCYLQCNQYQAAAAAYEAVLQKDPAHELTLRHMQKIKDLHLTPAGSS